jgi:hypothetical protein
MLLMLTAFELRLSLHWILQSRDAICDELQRRDGLTPDQIRQLAVQLAEFDQMITRGARTLSGPAAR